MSTVPIKFRPASLDMRFDSTPRKCEYSKCNVTIVPKSRNDIYCCLGHAILGKAEKSRERKRKARLKKATPRA